MKKNSLYISITIVLLIIFIAGSLILLIFNFNLEKGGQFGDAFGIVNVFFSGMAFLMIYRSLRLQQEQLDIQKEELRESRKELYENRVTNVIYKQIEMVTKLVDDLEYNQFKGVDALDRIYATIEDILPLDLEDQAKKVKWLKDNEHFLALMSILLYSLFERYRNSLHLISSILSKSPLEEIEKQHYVKLFQENFSFSLIRTIETYDLACKIISDGSIYENSLFQQTQDTQQVYRMSKFTMMINRTLREHKLHFR